MNPPPGDGTRIDRRDFIRRIGFISLGAATGSLFSDHRLYSRSNDGFRLSETRNKLGTFFHITLICESKEDARELVEASFHEVDRLSGLLNRHREGTPVWTLNRSGAIDDPPFELTDVIRRSIEWNRSSRGSFDITVEPIVSLYRRHFEIHRTPPPEERILELAAAIGSDRIDIDESGIRFLKERMGITLDGVAKGYIVDRVVEVLRKQGVRNAMINAGGDIRAIGGKEGGKPWTVAIQDPFRPGVTRERFTLRDGAVATSGNYQVYYDRDKVFHHIVDPRTGHSPHACASTTIRSDRTADADALSTALFVMTPEAGIHLVNRLPGIEGLILTSEGKQVASNGWEAGKDFF